MYSPTTIHSKIEITDIEAPVFKELLRYLYTVSDLYLSKLFAASTR